PDVELQHSGDAAFERRERLDRREDHRTVVVSRRNDQLVGERADRIAEPEDDRLVVALAGRCSEPCANTLRRLDRIEIDAVPDGAGDLVSMARKPDPRLRQPIEPAAIELDLPERGALGRREPVQQAVVRLENGAELTAERGEA